MEEERWAPIPGHTLYHVSDQGNVWSVRTQRILRGSVDRTGHLRFLIAQGYSPCVEVLVARAFTPESEWDDVVVHKDRDLTNNHISNLMWLSEDEAREFKRKRRGGYVLR